jgi:tetratricopeptide (TPR) repeat protein
VLKLYIGGLSIVPFVLQMPALPQQTLQAAAEKVRPALVTVIARDAQGKELRQGSGFFITKDGHLITGRGVLEGASSAEVKTAKNTKYTVKGVVAESTSAGIVRLAAELKTDEVEFAELAQAEPELGQPVILVANSLEAKIGAIRNIPGLGYIFRIGAPMPQDLSGTPIVNAKGEVVGVVLWQAPEPDNTSFAISGDSILSLYAGEPKALAERERPGTDSASSAAENHYRTGLGRLFLDDYEGALSEFEHAIQSNGKHAEAWFHAGFVKGKLGRAQEKMDAYQQAVRIKPDYASAHYSLGVSYALAGEREPALAEYETLKTLDPPMAERLQVLIHFVTHEEHEEHTEQQPQPPANPI